MYRYIPVRAIKGSVDAADSLIEKAGSHEELAYLAGNNA